METNIGNDINKWPDRIPLRDADLPDFPVEILPQWLRDMVIAVATFTQTPTALAGMLALAAVSIAIAKKAVLRVCGDWKEILTFSSVTAMEPGTRKSPVFDSMMRPLKDIERALMIDPVNPRRIFADDATPEATASLMARNGGFIASASPEGGVFGMLAGRYGRKPNLDLYLKGFTGEDVIIDRKDRTETIRSACLPMNVTVQPDVIRSLARTPEFMGRGLLARLCYAMPKDNLGWREIEPPAVTESISAVYAEKLSALALAAGESHVMIPTPGGLRALQAFQAWVEPQLRPTGDLFAIRGWAAKLPGLVARVSALLHLAEYAGESAPWDGGPSATTIEAATNLGKMFLIPHARVAFQTMGEDPTVQNAELLLNWIIRHKKVRFSRREAHRGTPSVFADKKNLDDAIDLLSSKHYVRELDQSSVTREAGRPASPLFEVNPKVFDEIDGTPTGGGSGNSVNDSTPVAGNDNAETVIEGDSVDSVNEPAPVAVPDSAVVAEPSNVVPITAAASVQPGDLWALGEHRLLCGDATKPDDLARLMDGEKADLCVTDPPYNIAYGKPISSRRHGREAISNDNLGDKFPAFVAAFCAGIKAATKPGAALYSFMSVQEMDTLKAALRQLHFHWSGEIIWDKGTPTLGWSDYRWQHEPIWYGWNGDAPRIHPVVNRRESTVWHVPGPRQSKAHPTMKPVELYARAINNSSSPGEIVLDPFAGSGTAIIACERTGRRCRAIELDLKYVQSTIARWEAETGETAVRITPQSKAA